MKEYLEKYRSRIIIMGLFVFFIHGARLHSAVIGIDTEDIIHIGRDFYGGWLNTGRQGLYALKWLSGSLTFHPYMAGLLTLLCFSLAVSAFFLLWDSVLPKGAGTGVIPWAVGGLFWISHPVMTEQFYFTLQSVEICVGIFLTAAALYLISHYREKGNKWLLFAAFLILLLTFSIYQAFVVLFIFGTVSVLLLQGISGLQSGGEISAGKLLKGVIPYLLVFLASFLLNTLITRLFFSASDYLDGQILWGKFAVTDNFRAIAGHIMKAFTGYESLHYHFSYGLLCLAAAGLTCVSAFRRWKQHRGAVVAVLFYLAALLFTPFFMTVVCGGAPAIRSQLVLPVMTGFLAYFSVCLSGSWELLSHKESQKNVVRKTVLVCVVLICLTGIWGQLDTTMSLYYTDQMRYEQDEALGRELIAGIDRVRGNEDIPVAVIGRKPFEGNHACVTGEIIGKSFFDHDTDVEPQYYWSTRRALGFLHILGADYSQVDMGRIGEAVQYSAAMPIWPAEGSIQLWNGIVVVKLSEPE